jgi:hypothetical protein
MNNNRWTPYVERRALGCGHDEAIVFAHPYGLNEEIVTCTECDHTNAAFISYEEEHQ